MKKLEDIPKKNIFEVPEGYFDRLPGIIQARVSESKPSFGWHLFWVALRYAVAVLLVVAVGIFWFTRGSLSSMDKIKSELASIDPGQLVEYLDEHELATEDLAERIAWSSEDLNNLENSVYADLDVPHQEIEKILKEYDVEL